MNSHKELQRIEAFSDGVFAIACTLLVLEFKVPHVEDMMRPGALWPALKAVWPSFVAYLISFGSILVAWAGHHRALNMLVRSSKAFLYANGLLLLTVTFMPFPTAVLAEYINTPQANIAVMFFSAACGHQSGFQCVVAEYVSAGASVSRVREQGGAQEDDDSDIRRLCHLCRYDSPFVLVSGHRVHHLEGEIRVSEITPSQRFARLAMPWCHADAERNSRPHATCFSTYSARTLLIRV